MANAYTSQVLEDSQRNYILVLTGLLDTGDRASTTVVDVSTMTPVPTIVRIDNIQYSITDQLTVNLYWDADTDDLAYTLNGYGSTQKFKKIGGLQNPKSAGYTGNINLSTSGWASGIQSYTLTLHCVKQGTPWSQT